MTQSSRQSPSEVHRRLHRLDTAIMNLRRGVISMYRIAKIALVFTLFPGALALWAETLPKDTQIVVRLDKDVERDENKKQTFTASLAYPIFVHGREAVPAGTRIEGDVGGTKKTNFLSPGRLVR